MQHATPGQDNIVSTDQVAKATGGAIISGTVNAYLRATTGDNAGKWWDGSAWSATEVTAGAMTFAANAAWEITIDADAWDAGIKYQLYGKESGGLNIPLSDPIITGYIYPQAGAVEYDYAVTDSNGNPVPDAKVWCTLGATVDVQIVQEVRADSAGTATFLLPVRGYYFHATKDGFYAVIADYEEVS